MIVLEIVLAAFILLVAALIGYALTPSFIRVVSCYLHGASRKEKAAHGKVPARGNEGDV